MCLNLSLFLLWLLLVVALSAVMTVFIQLKLSCDDIDSGDVDLECLPGNSKTNSITILYELIFKKQHFLTNNFNQLLTFNCLPLCHVV